MIKANNITLTIGSETQKISKSFEEANRYINTLRFEKTFTIDFIVDYADGYKYKGKLNIDKNNIRDPDLIEHHMFGKVKWNAGLARNPYCGLVEYQKYLAQPKVAENIEKNKYFLSNYQIGDGDIILVEGDKKYIGLEELTLLCQEKVQIIKKKEIEIKNREEQIIALHCFVSGIKYVLELFKDNYYFSWHAIICKTCQCSQDENFLKGALFAVCKLYNRKLSLSDFKEGNCCNGNIGTSKED